MAERAPILVPGHGCDIFTRAKALELQFCLSHDILLKEPLQVKRGPGHVLTAIKHFPKCLVRDFQMS